METILTRWSKTMKIAVCAQDKNHQAAVDSRFGRSPFFAVFDDQTNQWVFIENAQDIQAAQGAGTQAAQFIIDAEADILLARNVGPKAVSALQAGSVKLYKVTEGLAVEQAVQEYLKDNLESMEEANVEGHWI
jgi:predicted Fe-Mo cluster-binding NifX family protein